MNMSLSVSDCKAIARRLLLGKYGVAVALCLLLWAFEFAFYAVTGVKVAVPGGGFASVITAVVQIMLCAGFNYFFLNIARGNDYNISDLFCMVTKKGMPRRITTLICGQFMIELLSMACISPAIIFISYAFSAKSDNVAIMSITIGTVLLVVGLILMIRVLLGFSMFTYILLDTKSYVSVMNILISSRYLMRGRKLKLLYLYVSFIGWAILGVLSLGIGFLWIIPYFQTTVANFYLDAISTLQIQHENMTESTNINEEMGM